MRTSYTEISPDAKPMPTTSMAGDCAMAVIAALEPFWLPDGAVKREEDENLWMQVLSNAEVSFIA